MSDGVRDARALVTARDWKLIGAVAYYAFDNAVLWAAFHAFGNPPAIGVIVMGYLEVMTRKSTPVRMPEDLADTAEVVARARV